MADILDFPLTSRAAQCARPQTDDDAAYSFWPEIECGLWSRQAAPDPNNAPKRVGLEIALILGATAGLCLLASLLSTPASADPLAVPAMSASLSANPNPFSVDLGDAGRLYFGGAVSGLAFDQDNPNFGTRSLIDLDNGQAWIAKTDGWWQFYVSAGAYSFPLLGQGYVKSAEAPALLYGDVPVAYVKIQPTDNFSIEAGKLPTLIGDEAPFTFQNLNIQRGLLWTQEPTVSRGVQANWSSGPVSLAVSVNDGFYSGTLDWISGSAAYAFNGGADTLSVIGGGNLGRNPEVLTFATPEINNGSIVNVIYTHTSGPWTISPYFQYTQAEADPLHGVLKGAASPGGAVLVNYAFDEHWKLAGRVEYASSTGNAAEGAANVSLAGPGSKAWSVTLTPTYQYKVFFARVEGSYVGASDITPGFAYGPTLDRATQTSVFLEAGVLL